MTEITGTSICDAGTLLNEFTDFVIKDAEGNEIPAANYAIEWIHGELTVNPKPVEITTMGYTGTYDGMWHTNTKYQQKALVDGHYLTEITGTPICDAGTLDNEFTSFIIKDAAGNKIPNTNYEIEWTHGELKVSPKDITITTLSGSWTYDGAWHTNTGYSDDGLVVGHKLVDISSTSICNVNNEVEVNGAIAITQNLTNIFTSYKIQDADGNEVSRDNYNITWVEGTLEITPKPITVFSASASQTYNGTALSADGWTGDVLDGHAISGPALTSSITDVGSVENKCEGQPKFTIMSGNDDVTDNYQINASWGTLTVNPIEITVSSASASRPYDGTKLTADGWEVTAGELLDGHTITGPTPTAKITNVGTAENKYSGTPKFNIYDADGNPVSSDNYKITYTWGTLEVTPREITITTIGHLEDWYYNGKMFCETGYTATNIVEGHYLSDIVSPEIRDVSSEEIYNVFSSYNIYDEDGNLVSSDNYTITWVHGKLKVLPRKVTIATNGVTREYDAQDLYSTEYISLDMPEGHYLVVNESTVIRDVGTALNKFNAYVIKDAYGRDVSPDNYDITWVHGELKVTPKVITITTGSDSWIYNNEWYSQTGYSEQGLVSGHYLDNIESTLVRDVSSGMVYNEFTSFTIYYYNYEKDIIEIIPTDNYIINWEKGTLNVTPRPITVISASASQIYNGEKLMADGWSVISGDPYGLVYGHTLAGTALSSSITNVGKIFNTCGDGVEPVFTVTAMVDGVSTDVTNNYLITYQWGTLEVTKRQITVVSASATKEYDGTKLMADGWSVLTGSLVGNHTLSGTTPTASIINVGAIHNTSDTVPSFTVIADGVDVTGNYEIAYTWGALEVMPKTIIITTDSYSWEYDGAWHSDIGYTAEGILSGHELHDIISASINNAGTRSNEFTSFTIKDAEGNVIPDANYTIIWECGELKVTPKYVAVMTNGYSWEYDGKDHTYTGYVAPELVTGHYISVTESTVVRNAGTALNDFTSFMIKDAAGNEVPMDNYTISFVSYGTLEVTPRVLTVTTDSATFMYDGSSHRVSYSVDNLAEGHRIGAVTQTTAKNAGIYVNELIDFTIYDYYGNPVSKSNYTIVEDFGTIEITKRPITIVGASASKIYDGTKLTADGWRVIAGELLSGHAFSGTQLTSELTSVGKIFNTCGEGVEPEFKIWENDENVTGNYEITYIWGTLEITPRPITVIGASGSKTYDGTKLMADGWSVISGDPYGLVYGHTLAGTKLTSELTNVGKIFNTCGDGVEPTFTVMSDGVDVTGNYLITYQWGTLEVTKRQITVVSASATKEYDGTKLMADGWSVLTGSLVGNHTLSGTKLTASIVDAGKVDNTCDAVPSFTVMADGVDVTGNYEIAYVWGALEITPKTITITTDSVRWEYDGVWHSDIGYTVEGILSGHELNDIISSSILDAGTRSNEFTSFTIKDAEGNVIPSANYTIIWEYGELKVEPRSVAVMTNGYSWEYDGKDHTYTGYAAPDLVTGHYISVTESTVIRDAGTAPNKFTKYTIIDAEGNEIPKGNYTLSFISYGTLEVTPRLLTIETYDSIYEYDGSWKEGNGGYSVYNLAEGQWFVDVQLTSVKNAGVYVNALSEFTIWSSEGVVSKSNYTIVENYGTIEITKRPITVVSASATKEYDGTKLMADGWYISFGSLVNGQSLVGTALESELTNVGKIFNTCGDGVEPEFVIRENDENVTDNYEITYIWGTLEVTPRPITVISANAEKTYDGEELTASGWSVMSGELVSGHTLVGTELSSSIINAGSVLNTCDGTPVFIVRSGDGVVTSNYAITYVWGTLTVKPIEITVETGSAEKTYDGEYLTVDEFTIVQGSMLSGHTIEFLDILSVVNAGVYTNYISYEYEIRDTNGEIVPSENYAITWQYGTLTINRALIQVYIPQISVEYNGQAQLCSTEYSIKNVNADDFMLKFNISRINSGTVTMLEINESFNTNDGIYTYQVFKNGEDMSNNYIVQIVNPYAIDPDNNPDYAVLEIKQRIIKFTTADATEKYEDGKILEKHESRVSGGSLVSGHEFTMEYDGILTVKGEAQNIARGDTIIIYYIDENGGYIDVTDNYRFYDIDEIGDRVYGDYIDYGILRMY